MHARTRRRAGARPGAVRHRARPRIILPLAGRTPVHTVYPGVWFDWAVPLRVVAVSSEESSGPV